MAEVGVKEVLKKFKKDPIKNANIIVDFLVQLENCDLKTFPHAITTLHKIFIFLLKKREIQKPSKLPEDVQDATDKYSGWLYQRYQEFFQKLVSSLNNSAASIQELSLCSLVKLIQAEGRYPIGDQSDSYPFPRHRLMAVINAIISDSYNFENLIKRLQEFMEYQDFQFFTLGIVSGIVKQHKDEEKTEVYMKNLFCLLEQFDIPKEGNFPLPPKLLLLDYNKNNDTLEEEEIQENEAPFVFPYAIGRKHLNRIWTEVPTYKLTNNLYRRCLVMIPEKVMHHLDKPVLLTDFFIESYNMGGAISLLALQGVFILVNQHNLEYPDFYTKLYALFDPVIFHSKYQARFFMLSNLFLSSTHIPEYLVAAFVKRLSRLSLEAPSSSLILIIKFIANLLVRFPGLRKLINNPDDSDNLEQDPYDAEESDPALCKATKSSLWEIASLKGFQGHGNPHISRAAAFIEGNPPDMEHDISQLVENDYEDLYQKSKKIKTDVSTTFYKPQPLLQNTFWTTTCPGWSLR